MSIQTNDPIKSLWIGGSLSPVEQLVVNSYLKNNHPFILYTYAAVADVPDGVEIRDANEVISSSEIFLSHGSYAHFADWFRWRLLNLHGGYWSDMDVVCLKPLQFTEEIVFGFEAWQRPNVSILKFPKGHPVCMEMEDRCQFPNKLRFGDGRREVLKKLIRHYLLGNKRESVGWGEAGGPDGFRRVLDQFGLMESGLPFTYFYPIHHTSAHTIFDETFAHQDGLFVKTHALHLWNEIIRRNKINKNGPFPEHSLIQSLIRKYR